jgi:N-acetylglucosamine malate deacetylase 1
VHRACRLRARRLDMKEVCRKGRWLFLVPHPDDEVLGCGGVLSRLAAAGDRPIVVFLTDGAASHKGSPTWSAKRIAVARRMEAAASLRNLAIPPTDVFQLDWPDASPFASSSQSFAAGRDRLLGLCRMANIRAIATTWSGEPHCDHQAAFELAKAVSGRSLDLYEYIVWGWTLPDLRRKVGHRRLLRVDVRGTALRRKRALACHRTQMTGLISDATEAFRLRSEMMALAGRDVEILLAPESSHHAS